MAKQTFDPTCPRCGAEPQSASQIIGRIRWDMAYQCGSYYDSKAVAKRLGLKWDGRLRVGKDCDPKRKGGKHG
jgi:hypothetical protein